MDTVDPRRAWASENEGIRAIRFVDMARKGISDEEAFAMLRETSQRNDVKLRDLAQWLVEEHESAGSDRKVEGSDGAPPLWFYDGAGPAWRLRPSVSAARRR